MTLEQDIKDIEYYLNLLYQLKNVRGVKELAKGIIERAGNLKSIDKGAVGQFQEILKQVYRFEAVDDIKDLMPILKEDATKAFELIKSKLAQQKIRHE